MAMSHWAISGQVSHGGGRGRRTRRISELAKARFQIEGGQSSAGIEIGRIPCIETDVSGIGACAINCAIRLYARQARHKIRLLLRSLLLLDHLQCVLCH